MSGGGGLVGWLGEADARFAVGQQALGDAREARAGIAGRDQVGGAVHDDQRADAVGARVLGQVEQRFGGVLVGQHAPSLVNYHQALLVLGVALATDRSAHSGKRRRDQDRCRGALSQR